ncbi:enoyl-CoA hydratase [Actinocorallia aurea]
MTDTAPTSPAEDVVIVERSGAVALVRLNRPEARNALNTALMTALLGSLAELDADPGVHAIVLTGTGKAFCAGLDLRELGSSGGNLGFGTPSPGAAPNLPWPQLRTPLIGAINGPAVTGGFELALNCDILIGSEHASFADTHARVGVLPGWGLSVLLPLVVGRGTARRMSLTGDYVRAEEALRVGLLTEVVPADDLVPTALALAETIARNDPAAVQTYLASYKAIEEAQIGEGYRVESETSTGWLEATFDPAKVEARRQAIIERGKAQTAR